ncbi:MAG TPA: hypothetical protein VMY43_08035 [Methanothrix sp.]|nr:hypothetical protein [Methanothrix sp.]
MDQGLGYIGAAILGALATNAFQIYRDNEKDKRHKRDDRIRSINELRGIKHTMLQSKASYYSAFFASESLHSAAHILAIRIINYDAILSQRRDEELPEMEDAQQYVNRIIEEYLDNSPELKEYLRLKQRSEDLQTEIAKNDERFWKTIGRIRILFPNDEVIKYIVDIKNIDCELGKFEDEVINSIDSIRNEIRTTPGTISNNRFRNSWTNEKKNELQEWSSTQKVTLQFRINEFDSKIDNLLNYLEGFQDTCCRDCKFFCSDKKCPMRPEHVETTK